MPIRPPSSARLILLTLSLLGAASLALYVTMAGGPPTVPADVRHPLGRRASIPKIDVHVHVSPSEVSTMLGIMDGQAVVVALNASGGTPGNGSLERSAAIAETSGGRLLPYCSVALGGVESRDFPVYARATLQACKRLGAIGLKVGKSLGLGIVLTDGSLLRADDPRLDPVFQVAGELDLPVLIHTGDPQAFFRASTPDNERYAELSAHPAWSFHGERPDGSGPWPTWEEVFVQYENRVARHPATTFVGAHFGNAPEDVRRVGRMLDRYPNLVIETGARIPEIGRHDAREMRQFFLRYQDRILFGTDLQVGPWGLALGSSGAEPDTMDRVPAFFEAHFRYFETRDRRIAHPTPIQGNWRIDAIGLDLGVLKKLYFRNASRVFGIDLATDERRSEAPPEAP